MSACTKVSSACIRPCSVSLFWLRMKGRMYGRSGMIALPKRMMSARRVPGGKPWVS
jgi:hypothetical protein